MKKLGKYLIITLLLLLGLCCVGVLYLFFVPNSSLFEIKYISLSQDHLSEVYEYDSQSFSTIQLTSNAYDVDVVVQENSKSVSVKVYANSWGFVLKNNSEVNISSSVENSILKFNVEEPNGWAIKNASKITLYLPAEEVINLNLINNSAKTTIRQGVPKIDNLIYKTKSGNLTFEAGQIDGKLNLDLGSSTFKLSDAVQLNQNDVNLRLTSGKFDASASADLGNVDVEYNEYGVILLNNCNQLRSDNRSSGGRIEASKINKVRLIAGDTNLKVDELVTGNVEIYRSGSVSVNTVSQSAVIHTQTGKINISNAQGYVQLSSSDGEINVSSAYSAVNADTSYGDINVTFAPEAPHADSSASEELFTPRHFQGSTEHGKVTIKNVENITLNITGRGRAYVYFENVFGKNEIKGSMGEIYVEVKELNKILAPTGHAHYKLTTRSESGSVSVNTQQFAGLPYTGRAEESVFYINCTAEQYAESEGKEHYVAQPYNNSLTVSTVFGSVKLRDSLTVNY